MTYEQALAVGNNIEGYIKCTYAEISIPKHGLLFSLQRKATSKNIAKDDFEQNIGELNNPNADATVYMQYDIPVVKAISQYDKRMVAVRLTDVARDIIASKIRNKKGYEELRKALQYGETVYVKECAIDWIPTDVQNVTITDPDGNEIKLTDALEAARKRLERAKAILAAATTVSII